MKLSLLMTLIETAEVALPHMKSESARHDARTAIDAAHSESRKRMQARDVNRRNRPSRTVRREAIRENLALNHHKVRLTRSGEWHVQAAPGMAWMLFALSDSDAENLLNS